MLPALHDASSNHSTLLALLAWDGSLSHTHALIPSNVCGEDTKYKIEALDINKADL